MGFCTQNLVKENISEDISEDIPGDIPEEIIKSDVSEQEPENVPELEAEPAKPGESPVVKEKEVKEEQKPQMDPADFSKTMKLPELKIPKSMKNMEMSSAPKVPDLPKTGFSQSASGEFNLEDSTINCNLNSVALGSHPNTIFILNSPFSAENLLFYLIFYTINSLESISKRLSYKYLLISPKES